MPVVARMLFPPDAPAGSAGQALCVLPDGTVGWSSAPGNLVYPAGAPTGDPSGNGDLAQITAQLNAAAGAGGGVVMLRSGQTYTINTPNSTTFTTPSGGTTSLSFGIVIPSNVTLDLNGATIKAASGATGGLICNAHPTNGGGDTNIGLISSSGVGVIDGNSQVPPVGARGLVEFAWTTAPRVFNIKIQNGYTVGFYAYGNTNGNYDLISTNSMKGGGIDLGQPFTAAMEFNATVGRLLSMNTSPEPGNTFFNPGNGVYLVASGGTTLCITGINNTGGDKLDRPSIDHQITAVYGINNGDSNGNSGFKFQGDTSSSTTTSSSPVRCEVGLIHMVNQNGTGLYMEGCVDCTVAKYIGENNGLAGGGLPDVWIGGIRDTISELHSDNANDKGLYIRPYAVDPSFGIVKIRNPNQSNGGVVAAIRQDGGYAVAGRVLCVDELPTPTNVTATAVVGGGTFAGGQQFVYVVTYTNANGETTPGPEVAATPAANGSVVLTWGTGVLPSGVTGVKVYRATAAAGEYTSPALLTTLGAVLTYTDTGTAVSAGAAPQLNTATTKKMVWGVQQTTALAFFHAESLKVVGAGTAPLAANGGISQAMGSASQRLVSGQYIRPKTSNVGSAQPAQGVLSAMPLDIGDSGTIATIGVNVTTAGQAGALVRLGIYCDNGHGQPGQLLIDAGTVAGDAINKVETAVNLWVPAGRYHLAAVSQNCATTAPILSGSSGTLDPPIPLNSLANAWLTNQNCFAQSGVTGALPSAWGSAVQAATGVIPTIKAL